MANRADWAGVQTDVGDLQGQNNWASINADGTVARSSSNLAATFPKVEHTASSGIYEVDFGKDVSKCAYEAIIGNGGATAPTQGQLSVSGDVAADPNPNEVYVL